MDQNIAEKLEALLDGKLQGQERAEMETLARNSEAYREYLVHLKGIKLLADLSEPARPPYGIADRVMSRIMAPKQEASFQWSWAPSLGLAAACVILGLYIGSIATAPRGSSAPGQKSFMAASDEKKLSGKENLAQAMSALRNGDSQAAKLYLSAMEKTPDFEELKSKGLNMVVVRALLSQGDGLSLGEYLGNFVGKSGRLQL